MRIAFSIAEDTKPLALDKRFGRCSYFFILNAESGEIEERIENPFKDQEEGAGISAIKMLDDRSVAILVAPRLGPKAASVAKKLGLKVYSQGEYSFLEEIWPEWKNGALSQALSDTPGGLHRA